MLPEPKTNLIAAEEQKCQKTIARIAHEILEISTLEYRNHDSLDFYERGVGTIRDALRAAYVAGRRSLQPPQHE
jgi:hypothetical protein